MVHSISEVENADYLLEPAPIERVDPLTYDLDVVLRHVRSIPLIPNPGWPRLPAYSALATESQSFVSASWAWPEGSC